MTSPAAVTELSRELAELDWVSDLFVAGSLATGDYIAGVSDMDLVALTDGPVDLGRLGTLTALHRHLDEDIAAGLHLGCVYVDAAHRHDVAAKHPTWTHGVLVQRSLSLVTRAELVRYGYAVLGRPPRDAFAAMSADDIRAAARAELTGYWAWAARRPWFWLNPVIADLGLTSMARGRFALATGELLTKSDAIERIDAPAWLVDQVRARRRGAPATSPRLRTALIAWRDARRTTSRAARSGGCMVPTDPL